MSHYTSLAALKSFGSFESDKDDVLLDALIASASRAIESHTRRIFRIDDLSVRTYRKSTRHDDPFDGQILYLDEDLALPADGFNPRDDLPNLLQNPGFETLGGGGADIWANWSETPSDGALDNETSLEYEGANAAKMTAGANRTTTLAQNITVVAGKKYRIRFWTRGDATYGGRYRVRDQDNAADIIVVTTTRVVATTYAVIMKEWVAPAGCTTVLIQFWCPATDTGVCYFDACEVREKEPVYDLDVINPDNVLYIPENIPPYYALELTEDTWPSVVEVNGYWGYSKTPPPDIEIACLRLVKWLYDLRDTSQGAAVIVTPEGRVLLPQGLPSDVVTLLAPYVKLRVVA